MSPNDDPLAPFHPLVRAWFAERVGTPTEVQRLAWPRIAAGAHLLAAAPTGSGKTLAAFLWAIDRLLTGAWKGPPPRRSGSRCAPATRRPTSAGACSASGPRS